MCKEIIRKVCVFSFLIASVIGQANPNNLIAISAEYLNGEYCNNESVFFSYKNIYNDQVQSNWLPINGQWRVVVSDSPVSIIFSWGWKLYPVYAMPGDSIQVNCNGSRGFEFYGNRNFTDLNALNIVERKVGFLAPGLSELKLSDKLDFQYLSDALDSLNARRIKILDSLYRQGYGQLHSVFSKMLKYKFMSEYLMPYWPIHKNFPHKDVPFFYVQKCKSFENDLSNDTLNMEHIYYAFISNYNNLLVKESSTSELSNKKLYQSASRFFMGHGKDYLLFKYMKEDLMNDPMFVRDFRSNCKNKLFIKYIDSLIVLKEGFHKNEEILESVIAKTNASYYFQDFLRAYRGKPIYIDFWASWCQPCIKEIEPLKVIENKFKDRISFVSVSIDSDRRAWLSAIEKYSLDNEKQWITERNTPLGEFLNLQEIPRFILLGADGQLISSNAPRPDNLKELIILLEGALDR